MDFLQKRIVFLGIAFIMSVFSLLLFFFGNVNYGIDMTGGTQSEFSYEGEISLDDVYADISHMSGEFNQINNNIINGVNVYGVTGQNQIVLIVGFHELSDEKELENLKTEFNELAQNYLETLPNDFIQTRYINIGKNFGDYIKNTAKITLILGLIAISIYIIWAFFGVANGINTYSFAGVVIITLLFDILVTTGLYIATGLVFPEFQVDIFFITALLTILGYSINNTIVVFDRVRFNIKQMISQKKQLYEIINVSLSETIKRSIFTSLTLLFVLVTTFLFGPELMRGFLLSLIFGVTLGTFSSLLLAPSLLFELNKNAELKAYEKKVVTDEDKLVV